MKDLTGMSIKQVEEALKTGGVVWDDITSIIDTLRKEFNKKEAELASYFKTAYANDTFDGYEVIFDDDKSIFVHRDENGMMKVEENNIDKTLSGNYSLEVLTDMKYFIEVVEAELAELTKVIEIDDEMLARAVVYEQWNEDKEEGDTKTRMMTMYVPYDEEDRDIFLTYDIYTSTKEESHVDVPMTHYVVKSIPAEELVPNNLGPKYNLTGKLQPLSVEDMEKDMRLSRYIHNRANGGFTKTRFTFDDKKDVIIYGNYIVTSNGKEVVVNHFGEKYVVYTHDEKEKVAKYFEKFVAMTYPMYRVAFFEKKVVALKASVIAAQQAITDDNEE